MSITKTTPAKVKITDGTNDADVTASNAVKVDGSAVTQPVSAASLPLPSGAATSSNQTDGSQKTQIVDSGGDIVDVIQLNTNPTTSNKGLITNSVIHGLSSAGGGTFVDVKVNPSGTLEVNANQATHDNLNANANIQVANADVGNSNPVPVSDAGGSLTVDGTVTANAGTGTFAISAASLPLPTGAATAAKQPALGTAGSASADVITVQGIASMTALKVDGSAVTQPISGTVAATQSGTWILGANSGVDVGDVTINNASGASAVNIQDGGNSITVDGTVAATQSGTWNIGTVTTITNAVTVSQSTASSLNATVRLQDGSGSAVSKGQTTMSGSLPVVLASDQSTVNVAASGNSVIVSVTPTISTSAYTADDQIGGQQTITSAVRSSGGTATLHSITIIDKAKQNADIDIFFFDQSTTIASSDNAALDISDTNMASNCIGMVKVRGSDYSNLSANSVVSVRNVGLTLDATGSTSLFAVAKIGVTATYGTTSDLVFKYHFLQD